MKRLRSILMIMAMFLVGTAYTQSEPNSGGDARQEEWCKSHEVMVDQMENNIEFIHNLNTLYEPSPQFDYSARNVTIPVVIHVVYRYESQKPSEEDINSQMEALNRDFNMCNESLKDINERFEDLVADFQITFKLATVDPDGKPTDGITYTETDKLYFTHQDDVKSAVSGGKLGWNSKKYLNIWVCKLQWGLLGYAQFPGGDFITDGVVVDYNAFGVDEDRLAEMEAEAEEEVAGKTDKDGNPLEPEPIVNKPCHEVLTHEIGHWLGLRHIWGDALCGDDKCEDTPHQMEPHWDCFYEVETCGSIDLNCNFMDYLPNECMSMFTHEQKKLAWKALKLYRKEMLKRRNQKLCK